MDVLSVMRRIASNVSKVILNTMMDASIFNHFVLNMIVMVTASYASMVIEYQKENV